MKKWVWTTLGVLAIAGGLVHILQPLGFNLLSYLGSFAGWVQVIAGVSTLIYVGKKLRK